MAKAAKLTDTQLVILNHAARRPDGRVLPMPESLGNRGGTATRALKSLLKRAFIAECRAGPDDHEWTRSDEGERLTLKITREGLTALGLDGTYQPASSSCGTSERNLTAVSIPEHHRHGNNADGAAKSAALFRTGTKGAAIMELLKRTNGATLSEMTQSSGWQPHSIRGFLSGTVKKKHGIAVSSMTDAEGARRYRLDLLEA